ncbi:MAG: zf-HC2 domain-containing protein [Bryobacterales bacterium]|nr:zf-HC2 domain-containing protein [Bryobacterales bacterium]
MKCPEVIERLPWLLNDTLPRDERSEVLSHLEGCAECRKQLEETAAVLEAVADHPAADRLAEYVMGAGMKAAEQAAIGKHLAACRQCAEEVELLRESAQQMPARRFGTMRYAGIAAMLVIAASAGLLVSRVEREAGRREAMLRGQVRELEERLERLGAPSATGQIVDLLPADARQRSQGGEVSRADAAAGVETTFLLASRLGKDATSCSITLLAGSKQLWTGARAVRGINGEFLVRVPAGFLQPGVHRVTVTCGAEEESFEFNAR